jgi:rubrerythrin
MTVMTRNSTGALLLRRRREGRPGRVAEPRKAQSVGRVSRRLDLPQDQATYACRCGYVFEAAVSTSVGCPHCGDSQAW